MFFQVVEKAAHPRCSPLFVRPNFDVLVNALENRPAQLQIRVHFVQRSRPLQIKSSVVFRQRIFPVRFFAHFHVRNRIAALFEIHQLGHRILRSVIEHRNRNHRGKPPRDAARKEKIKAHLVRFIVNDCAFMPGVNGRTNRVGLRAIRSVADDVVKEPIGGSRPEVEFFDCEAEAVAAISRSMVVAGIGRLCHQDPNPANG